MVIHHPPVGLIHTLSLSYPPSIPSPPKQLVVGKTHHTPTKNGASSLTQVNILPAVGAEEDDSSITPTKMTHRQKYEALLAATTRPPPFVLSAGLDVGGVVRSDPISGKISKGFWGPGRDGQCIQPSLTLTSQPTSTFDPNWTSRLSHPQLFYPSVPRRMSCGVLSTALAYTQPLSRGITQTMAAGRHP